MNNQKLRHLCKKIESETGLNFNAVQTHFFIESILMKIKESPYSDEFVYKGGFFISKLSWL